MASITTFFGTQGGGGISGSGAAGQVAFFDSASSVSGSNDLYWNSTDGVLAINSFDPTLAGSKLEIQGDNAPSTAMFTARTGQIWGGNTIMTLRERGCLELTSYNSTGSNLSSVFIGHSSIGQSASSAIKNVAIGHLNTSSRAPGQNLTTGDANILIGCGAGSSINSGSYNIAIGEESGSSLTTGSLSSFVGYASGLSVTTAVGNTAFGYGSLANISSTVENTAIGIESGAYRGTGTNTNTNCIKCVYLGGYTRSISAGGATNEIVIGYNAVGNGSNSVTLGDTTVTNTYLRGDINLVEGGDIVAGTSTGTQIGTSASQKLSVWGKTPIVQPTTAGGSATIASPGAGSTIKTDDTFDGYTLAQVVRALRNIGVLQ